MKDFSFFHVADLHLGYSQYGLEIRREDFDRVLQELVEKAVDLRPDFIIIAGDVFHHARPSNVTLESTIRSLGRLREARIPLLVVDGSHDSAPNMVTGTILHPLDSAGLIYHLPRHKGACWRLPGCCYVYGVPNFRTRRKTQEALPVFLEQNKPTLDEALFNIFVMHMAVDLPSVKPPYIEAEAPPELVPSGFDYYAAGHVHHRHIEKFKTGLLVYSGSVETIDYEESSNKKGFFHVRVDEKRRIETDFVELQRPRKFIVIDEEFTNLAPAKITERAVQLVREVDEEGAVIVPVLKGILPSQASRSEVDVSLIRTAAEKALLVHPMILLRESEVSEELVRSIFESELKDLPTKAFEYFLQTLSNRYSPQEAERVARVCVELIGPLAKKQEDRAKRKLEELIR